MTFRVKLRLLPTLERKRDFIKALCLEHTISGMDCAGLTQGCWIEISGIKAASRLTAWLMARGYNPRTQEIKDIRL